MTEDAEERIRFEGFFGAVTVADLAHCEAVGALHHSAPTAEGSSLAWASLPFAL